MVPKEELTVAELIRTRYEELTQAERQLASALLANYPVLGLSSITEVAAAAGVSSPTVVRMAKKLGFEGFPDLQTNLRSELEARISNPINKYDHWAAEAPDTHIVNRFADAVMDNLRNTLRHLSVDDFDAVVALLADPNRRVYLVGGRITRSIADYFFTHLHVIRDAVTLIPPNANTWPHYVLEMKPGDVLVVFDVRRYERDTTRFAKMARSKDVTIVAFTDQWGSPMMKEASYAFHARIEVPSAWDSSVVTLLLVEMMIAALQTRTGERGIARLRALEELFDQTKTLRKS
ncbi:MurR/RpiR family transcriptional regulator [Acuticoccus kandeliae]|uniref:MurR/RpiR family transcriptional regulator n=1 Tax=Acuticoccus kandeliae TaxID=2073160 RepID=UPI000D3E5E47|nr:MurR/RpiR family transcriptional regulator [Acuticoccus kandeliae]